jgi:energy-coupling factor transporter ATP-binding protein EcfA2
MNMFFNGKKALLIVGPEGSGKSILAGILAHSDGDDLRIDSHEFFNNPFALGSLQDNIQTVIVEDVVYKDIIADNDVTDFIKNLITQDNIDVQEKNKPPRVITTPNFIFTTGDATCLYLPTDCRRFRTIEIN